MKKWYKKLDLDEKLLIITYLVMLSVFTIIITACRMVDIVVK